MHSAGFSTGVSPWTYLLNQCVLITRYLQLAIWPRDLVFIYGAPQPLTLGDVLLPAAFVTAVGVGAIVLWFRRPPIGFLAVWVFITLAPTSSIVPIATEVGAERRMYLPLAALSVLAAVGLRELVHRMSSRSAVGTYVGWAVAAGLIAALIAGTIDRNREYASGLVLAETSLARWPTGAAHHTTAVELMLRGRVDEALPHLEAAVHDTPRAEYTFGVALMERQRWPEAIEHLQTFVRAEPSLEQVVSARTLLGDAWLRQGRADRAAEEFRLALQLAPASIPARVGLADALSRLGQADAAIDHYRRVVAAGSGNEQATRNLALLLFQRGDYAEAVTYARKNLETRPSDAIGQFLLGAALAELSRWDESIVALQEARRLDPANADAEAALARVLQLRAAAKR
jgi:tetratricopeptide (TPR) repeat protein